MWTKIKDNIMVFIGGALTLAAAIAAFLFSRSNNSSSIYTTSKKSEDLTSKTSKLDGQIEEVNKSISQTEKDIVELREEKSRHLEQQREGKSTKEIEDYWNK